MRNSETVMRSDLYSAAAELLAHFKSGVHHTLQVPLQPAAKVPEHSGATGQNYVLMHTQTHTILKYMPFYCYYAIKNIIHTYIINGRTNAKTSINIHKFASV